MPLEGPFPGIRQGAAVSTACRLTTIVLGHPQIPRESWSTLTGVCHSRSLQHGCHRHMRAGPSLEVKMEGHYMEAIEGHRYGKGLLLLFFKSMFALASH